MPNNNNNRCNIGPTNRRDPGPDSRVNTIEILNASKLNNSENV